MPATGRDGFDVIRTLEAGGRRYRYFSLDAAEQAGIGPVSRLPRSLKVLLENLLRHEDGETVTEDDIRAVARAGAEPVDREIAFRPARLMMPDSSGIQLIADLAAMRDAMVELGGDPNDINPVIPVDVIVDHSVMVDVAGTADAAERNMEIEFARNGERYEFIKWGQRAFENFRVIPPGVGICHQVNLEYLARVAWRDDGGEPPLVYPDTLLGMDSHTPMINALGVLGWGVGGIEAASAMLGQPVAMRLPEVVGCRLTGRPRPGVTTTDVVLTVTQILRTRDLVGTFVEFFGEGAAALPATERATLSNMAPEYGSTCGFFAVDEETLRYLRLTGRADPHVALVEAHAKAPGPVEHGRGRNPLLGCRGDRSRRHRTQRGRSEAAARASAPFRNTRGAVRRISRSDRESGDHVRGRGPELASPSRRRGTPPRSRAAPTPPTRRSWWPPACWRGTQSRRG